VTPNHSAFFNSRRDNLPTLTYSTVPHRKTCPQCTTASSSKGENRQQIVNQFYANNSRLATAPVAAASAATPASVTAAARALGARFGLVDANGSTFDLFAIESSNGRLTFGVRRHFNETETLGPSAFSVCNQRYSADLTELGEHRFDFFFVEVIR
jgi:hypothetical protein